MIVAKFILTTEIGVSPDQFAKIDRGREKRRRKFRFCYRSDSRVLKVTMRTRIHERLHLTFYMHCLLAPLVREGNLFENLLSLGCSTFGAQGLFEGDTGEADSTSVPISRHLGYNYWPTLVVEAGDTKSLNQLREDMRWWFAASNHEVKIVILTKFDHNRRCIILERWEAQEQSSQKVMTRRRAALLRQTGLAIRRQVVTITRDATTPKSYNVSGSFGVGFKSLFLRDRRPEEGEGEGDDVVIPVEDLQHYADVVWRLLC